MKKLYIMFFAVLLCLVSCREEELNPQSQVIDSMTEMTEFDKWLDQNYRAPYNINFLYRYEDIQTNHEYDLSPANELDCKIMAKMLRYLWIDVYSEIAGNDFMRRFAPRVLQIVGSGAYNDNNTINIGFAEGGMKIVLFVCNWLETADWIDIIYNNGVDETDGFTVEVNNIPAINGYIFKLIHHEFAHILHQTIMYPNEFKAISQNDYVAQWQNVPESQANALGFVSSYAMAAASEDFVETFSIYVTDSLDSWNARIITAGPYGSEIIYKKVDIVKSYFLSTWGIDVDEMRAIITRRYNDMHELDWSNFKTEE